MLLPRFGIFALFFVLALGNLVASGTGNAVLEWATKPFLMPVLGLWYLLAARARGTRPSRGVVAALLFSAAGDIALLNEGTAWFLAGMVLFLAAHVCYLTVFVRHGALARLRSRLWLPLGYGVILAAALMWLWSPLTEIGLAIPMTGYGLALAGTATLASTFGWRTGLGGALFLLSDLLIAVGVAEVATLPGPPIWVMLTYLSAQFLLAWGWLRLGSGAPRGVRRGQA